MGQLKERTQVADADPAELERKGATTMALVRQTLRPLGQN
jgi:hypothetical protein